MSTYHMYDDGQRLPGGGPLEGEHYGPVWEIRMSSEPRHHDPVVIIPDPGDGSAERLARKILELLNACVLA
jgi:hypothetical protein